MSDAAGHLRRVALSLLAIHVVAFLTLIGLAGLWSLLYVMGGIMGYLLGLVDCEADHVNARRRP